MRSFAVKRKAPISFVHCTLTAASFLMADATNVSSDVKTKALRGVDCCIKSLEELEAAWKWSTRSLVALANVAHAWRLDVSGFQKQRYHEVIKLQGPSIYGETPDCAFRNTQLDIAGMYGLASWDPHSTIEDSGKTAPDLPAVLNGLRHDSQDWFLGTMQTGQDWTLLFD